MLFRSIATSLIMMAICLYTALFYTLFELHTSEILCSFQLRVQKEPDPTETDAFRTWLFNKCQHELEKNKQEEIDSPDRLKKIDCVSVCVSITYNDNKCYFCSSVFS